MIFVLKCDPYKHDILRRVGIEHTEETEEAYTYAIQDITERAFRKIGKTHWK